MNEWVGGRVGAHDSVWQGEREMSIWGSVSIREIFFSVSGSGVGSL